MRKGPAIVIALAVAICAFLLAPARITAVSYENASPYSGSKEIINSGLCQGVDLSIFESECAIQAPLSSITWAWILGNRNSPVTTNNIETIGSNGPLHYEVNRLDAALDGVAAFVLGGVTYLLLMRLRRGK